MAGEQFDLFASIVPVPFLNCISSFASALDVFFDRSSPGFRDDASTAPGTPPTRLPRAASLPRSDLAIRTSSPLAPSLIPTWSCLAAGEMRLLAALECPQASAVSCVDGVLASVGDVQTCEEACDGECCVGGVCDEFTIRVCRDSTSCSGEGACRDVSIYDVFLGCEGTEVCYYAGNKGSGAWASCVP